MWEQPTESLQQYRGLLSFSTPSQTSNLQETLRQVAQQIDNIQDKVVKPNVAAAIISGLALDKEIIRANILSLEQS